jgi:hypothetical protein
MSGRRAISEILSDLPHGDERFGILALGDQVDLLHDFTSNFSSLRATVDGFPDGHPAIAW